MSEFGVFVDPDGGEHAAQSAEEAVELQFACGYSPKQIRPASPPAQPERPSPRPTGQDTA